MSEIYIFIICVCLTSIVGLSISLHKLIQRYKSRLDDIISKDRQIESRDETIHALEEKVLKLSKFQACVDAESKALEITRIAEDDAQFKKQQAEQILRDAELVKSSAVNESERVIAEAKEDAHRIITNAKTDASNIVSDAGQKVKLRLTKSEESLNDAIAKAKSIVIEAEDKARKIAGAAYDLSQNVSFYESALTSIKNTIKGYGLSYIKPLDSVLDGLASDYGFTEAGRELTQARNHTKLLVESNGAATCEYVEQNRRETAIAFVLDAFNGKVDTIIALLKSENYGILEQKIKDAYAIVNLLGKPFREARITQEYLDARLSELKWGAAVLAIKLKDKEEQRLIKERIREEERARREYEKAMRDAEKQEQAIRKAIEKATAQLSKANEEQKLKFENQLLELQEQLAEAEAKNQRALSMAQQTRSGHVYVISNIGSFGENVFKIGMTRRLEPLDRVRELGDASVPFPFDVHAMIFSEDAPSLETELHRIFSIHQVNKVNPRKEFFRLPITDIREYLDKKNLDIKWTILAEAAQYKETLALEESFRKNAHNETNWIKSQEENFKNESNYDSDFFDEE